MATEYVCSAVPFNRWKDVWRLSATLTDRPGLVADLSKVLELEKIDIICTRSTVLDRVRFMVDMHLDCNEYESDYDLDTNERQQNPMLGLEELQARICATLIKSIDLPFPLLPMVSLHRNHVLRSAAAQSQMTTSSMLTRGRLLVNGLQVMSPRPTPGQGPDTYYMVADQDHVVLRLFRVPGGCGVVHARIEFANKPGALRRVSKKLSDKGMTVFQAYARPVSDYSRCRADLLVGTPEWSLSEESLRLKVSQIVKDLGGLLQCCECKPLRMVCQEGSES